VYALAISPDGERLAIGHRERFSVWQIKTRSLIFSGNKGALSLAFHPDGKRLYTASSGTVREWDTVNWREAYAIPQNGGFVSLSADGRRLATLSNDFRRDREATIWDTTTWTPVATIASANDPIALSHDGRRLACGTATNIVIWTVDGSRPEVLLQDTADLFPTNQPLRNLRMQRRDHMLAFSRDDKQIVGVRNTLSSRGVFVLSVWNAETGEEAAVMPSDAEHIEHSGTITGLGFSPDGRTLASSSMDHSIRLWDFANHLAKDDIQGHLSEVLAVAYSPDGKFIASASKDGEIKIWPSVRQAREDVVVGPAHPVGFNKDGHTLLAMQWDFSAAISVNTETLEIEGRVDVEQRRREGNEPPKNSPPPAERDRRPDVPPNRGQERERDGRGMRFWGFPLRSTAHSPDLRWLVRVKEDGMVEWVDTEHSETNLLKLANGGFGILALANDGHTMFTRGREQGVRIWDLRASTNVFWPADTLTVSIAPDGRTLLAHRRDAMQLWDRATLTLQTNIVVPSIGFFETPPSAFTADGRLLALPAEDDAVALWDVASLERIATFSGHKQGIRSIAFSPDGRTLATTSDDSTLKLWNVATQQELLSLRNLGATLTRLLFSPDGRVLVGGSSALGGNGGLRLYRAATFEEINRALPVRAMADTE
jgi:WD40 repeat protein